MQDFDLTATTSARSTSRVQEVGTCGTCTKPMYREAPFPGTVSEWRHKSTGQPISWNPEKHHAGHGEAVRHNHRFSPEDDHKGRVCIIMGCDAVMEPARLQEAVQAPTGRLAKEAASRRRGVEASKRRLGQGTGF